MNIKSFGDVYLPELDDDVEDCFRTMIAWNYKSGLYGKGYALCFHHDPKWDKPFESDWLVFIDDAPTLVVKKDGLIKFLEQNNLYDPADWVKEYF